MTAQRTAGWVALISGALLAVLLIASAFAGPTSALTPLPIGVGMMSSSHMGNGMMGMGPGMMGFGSSGPAATAIPNATEVRVQAANFSFTPSEIRLPKGEVNLTFVNPAGTGVVHDLTVPGLAIHIVANPGETKTVGLRNLAPGRYDAYCSVPAHADLGMRVTVIVE